MKLTVFFLAERCLLRYEPPHDKTKNVAFAPSEDTDQPGQPPSLFSLRCPHEESLDP